MLITEGEVDPAGVRAIEQLLAERVCGSAVYMQQTASTNSRALADLSASDERSLGVPEDDQLPRLYVADAQTAGRGRRGRRWLSSAHSLTFSLLIRSPGKPARQPTLAPLAAGVGIARAIEFRFAPLRAWLKWPNDVYLDGGKVAGVLSEAHQNADGLLVVGIGINVGGAPELSSDAAAAVPPKSIAQCAGQIVPRYSILADLVAGAAQAIEQASEQPKAILDDFRGRCALTGREVSFQTAGGHHHGRCAGITDAGQLAVETSAGMRYCHSGEVSVRLR